MKTRIIELSNGDKTITLIGVIHVGSEQYYRNIQQELNNCEMVLFEGVTGMENSGLKKLYDTLAKLINLKGQKESIDYTGKWSGVKFIRSDVDESEISFYLKDFFDKMGDASIKIDKLDELDDKAKKIVDKILSKIILLALKNIKLLKFFFRNHHQNVLVDLRNYKVIGDVSVHINGYKHIGIFYGDAHLDHFVKFFKSVGFKIVAKRKYNFVEKEEKI